MESLTQWTWFWVGSVGWWWTGKPGVLKSMGLQRVRRNWVTEPNWNTLPIACMFFKTIFSIMSWPILFLMRNITVIYTMSSVYNRGHVLLYLAALKISSLISFQQFDQTVDVFRHSSLYIFILCEICWASWMCELMFLMRFWNFLAVISSNIFLSKFPSFLLPDPQLHICWTLIMFDFSPRIPWGSVLFSSFLFLFFRLDNFYQSAHSFFTQGKVSSYVPPPPVYNKTKRSFVFH